MKKPNERLAIINRIRATARRKNPFRILDLIEKWMGRHCSWDWQECLDYLVEKNELSTDGQGKYWTSKGGNK